MAALDYAAFGATHQSIIACTNCMQVHLVAVVACFGMPRASLEMYGTVAWV